MPDRTSHKPGTLSWADLATTDQEGAKEFYGGLFGWEYDERAGRRGPDVLDGEARRPLRRGDRDAAARRDRRRASRRTGTSTSPSRTSTRSPASACEAGGTVLAGPFDVFDVGRMSVIAGPDGRGPVPVAAGHEHRRRGRQRAGRAGVGRHRDDGRGGRAGVLRLAARLALRADERGAAVLGDLQRRAHQRRHDRPAARRAVQLVPLLRGRGRRRGDRGGRGGRRQPVPRARSTCPTAVASC